MKTLVSKGGWIYHNLRVTLAIRHAKPLPPLHYFAGRNDPSDPPSWTRIDGDMVLDSETLQREFERMERTEKCTVSSVKKLFSRESILDVIICETFPWKNREILWFWRRSRDVLFRQRQQRWKSHSAYFVYETVKEHPNGFKFHSND